MFVKRRFRPFVVVLATVLASLTMVSCGGEGRGGGSTTPSSPSASQSLLAVRAWTGTLDIRANQSGSGNSVQAGGMSITENYQHDSTAQFNVSLSKDPSLSTAWVGNIQGAVSIRNQNVMTMVAPGAIVVCTGTLNWIGNDPQFSGTLRIEADSSGRTVRLSLSRVSIPAPNSGAVECPTTGLQFPTTDPNSPFAPFELLSGLSMTPSSGGNQNLFAFTTVPGDSGIGGFVASPARINYSINLNLNAVP
jgi:hypothetical protein